MVLEPGAPPCLQPGRPGTADVPTVHCHESGLRWIDAGGADGTQIRLRRRLPSTRVLDRDDFVDEVVHACVLQQLLGRLPSPVGQDVGRNPRFGDGSERGRSVVVDGQGAERGYAGASWVRATAPPSTAQTAAPAAVNVVLSGTGISSLHGSVVPFNATILVVVPGASSASYGGIATTPAAHA